jgi:hypothetical protein
VAALKKKNPSVPFGRRSLPSVPAFAPGWDAFYLTISTHLGDAWRLAGSSATAVAVRIRAHQVASRHQAHGKMNAALRCGTFVSDHAVAHDAQDIYRDVSAITSRHLNGADRFVGFFDKGRYCIVLSSSRFRHLHAGASERLTLRSHFGHLDPRIELVPVV